MHPVGSVRLGPERPGARDQGKHVEGVDPGRLQQFLAQRPAELVDVPVECPARVGEEHLPHE